MPFLDFMNHDHEAGVLYRSKDKYGQTLYEYEYKKDLEVICMQDYEHFYGCDQDVTTHLKSEVYSFDTKLNSLLENYK